MSKTPQHTYLATVSLYLGWTWVCDICFATRFRRKASTYSQRYLRRIITSKLRALMPSVRFRHVLNPVVIHGHVHVYLRLLDADRRHVAVRIPLR